MPSCIACTPKPTSAPGAIAASLDDLELTNGALGLVRYQCCQVCSVDDARPDGTTAVTHTSLYSAGHHETVRDVSIVEWWLPGQRSLIDLGGLGPLRAPYRLVMLWLISSVTRCVKFAPQYAGHLHLCPCPEPGDAV
jgi:hypothetical protein